MEVIEITGGFQNNMPGVGDKKGANPTAYDDEDLHRLPEAE